MFNFNLQQKAFEELSAEQFRVVYFLNNTLSMVNESKKTPDNNKIEMFNGYLMDKLGLSERQVQRLIKRLEQLNYITVERATRKNQPNIITLNCDINNDINNDINCDKNVTLNKNTKENKIYNITKDFSTYGNSTCSDNDITKWTKVFNENNNLKENEMSDNGTSVMNDNEQGRSNASESDTINEMTTSTSGDKNKTSKEFQNIPVDKSKVINNDCNVQGVIPNAKDCAPAPATEEWKPVAWNEDAIFGSGERQNVSGDKLSTQGKKTQPEPQECPQIEFNREEMLQLMDMSANETDLDRFKEQLRKMDEYMQWLKLNDSFQYKLYVKEIYCWFKSHTWNMEFDFITLGSEFMRKYVA